MINFRNLISTLIFIGILALAPGIVRDSLADQHAKSEIAEINHVMYGLFSVDAWKSRISDVLISEIGKLNLKSTAKALRGTIENEMNVAIDQLAQQVREVNEGSMSGRIKQALIDAVVNVQTLKKGVPRYTEAILDQLGTPETQNSVKSLAKQKLKSYLDQSFTKENLGPMKRILSETGTDSVSAATAKLQSQIDLRRESLEWRSYILIALTALFFTWTSISANRTPFTVSLLFATMVILLGIGVSIPMIDLEAKISELSFVLLGHKISFENQILFFQSKSVINVFWLMIKNPEIKMKAVGLLMVTFSIVFPILKLGASLIYYFSNRLRESRVVQFLAFQIGKWSMADVMIIAIFMAYIGFNGIFESQFKGLKSAVPGDISLFTTNGTSLQMGYYIFVAYVLFAMTLSSLVHASSAHPLRTSKQ